MQKSGVVVLLYGTETPHLYPSSSIIIIRRRKKKKKKKKKKKMPLPDIRQFNTPRPLLIQSHAAKSHSTHAQVLMPKLKQINCRLACFHSQTLQTLTTCFTTFRQTGQSWFCICLAHSSHAVRCPQGKKTASISLSQHI